MADWLDKLLGVPATTGPNYDFSAFAEEEAEKNGCVVVYPQHGQVQLDLDTEAAYEMYQKRLKEFYKRNPTGFQLLTEPVVTPSKSGLPHRHVTLTFTTRKFTETERICFQVMLGSDPIRESLNAMRMFSGIEKPTRLFEPKP